MNKLIAALAAALCLTAAVTAYSDSVQQDLQSSIIRLHIIADSDSETDQSIKLKVRDAILTHCGGELKSETRQSAEKNIQPRLGEIEETANAVLRENGAPYNAHAEYGKFYFPKKSYNSLTLPAGEYYGVRVTLGSGEGHNWWCVLYPPMCLSEDGVDDTEANEKLKEELDDTSYDVITDGVTVKFRIVEAVQEVRQKLAAHGN